ncbi:MAG: pyridoxal-phosphate dependent enzyme [Gemmatimonadota bacterium]|nr:pyridoxal-phosphate dependent enzyme [Gemmatimonadota bacterium]
MSTGCWTLNGEVVAPGPYPARLRRVVGIGAHRAARAEIGSWPGYGPTPLRSADRLAGRLGVEAVWVKDESGRFGLGSFKALGGGYGVRWVVGHGSGVTVTCASDGNHGRAVAWGARMFGCDAVVYLPAHVTEARAEAIRSLGARVVRVDGEYDDAVARADRDAHERGWTVVSDTSYEGYMEIPRVVMVGYTVMVEEVLGTLRAWQSMMDPSVPTHCVSGGEEAGERRRVKGGGLLPTHVFIQGGVGGLAAAVIGHLWARLGPDRPVAVIVEPGEADGLLLSARAGRPTASRGSLHTIMAGLSCREISPLAWEVVGAGAHAFMTVADEGVPGVMREAARGELGEPFEGGESGVAGLLGLIEVARDGERRRAIGLDERSRVLVFNTEGATDPGRYARIVRGGKPE